MQELTSRCKLLQCTKTSSFSYVDATGVDTRIFYLLAWCCKPLRCFSSSHHHTVASIAVHLTYMKHCQQRSKILYRSSNRVSRIILPSAACAREGFKNERIAGNTTCTVQHLVQKGLKSILSGFGEGGRGCRAKADWLSTIWVHRYVGWKGDCCILSLSPRHCALRKQYFQANPSWNSNDFQTSSGRLSGYMWEIVCFCTHATLFVGVAILCYYTKRRQLQVDSPDLKPFRLPCFPHISKAPYLILLRTRLRICKVTLLKQEAGVDNNQS